MKAKFNDIIVRMLDDEKSLKERIEQFTTENKLDHKKISVKEVKTLINKIKEEGLENGEKFSNIVKKMK